MHSWDELRFQSLQTGLVKPGKENSKVVKFVNDTKVLKQVKSREGHMELQSVSHTIIKFFQKSAYI